MSTARPSSDIIKPTASTTRVAIVAARFNADIVDELLAGCTKRLAELNVDAGRQVVMRVPGAFELPSAASMIARQGGFDAIIAIGCVIRGDTPHFEYVAGNCATGLMQVGIEYAMPVIFGVLTTNTHQQALDRTGGSHGHAGVSAAEAAVEMMNLKTLINSR
jgi:6,7-dimethyl-8-ribityllumazine synthase